MVPSGSATQQTASTAHENAATSIIAPATYTVAIFAMGSGGNTNPDAIFARGGFVYVAFQNATTATGGGGNSTIVQYDTSGKVVRSIQVPGHCDGMRYNPYTRLVWLTVNEDANSALYTWKPSTGALVRYTFSAAAHMGGYDDLAFTGNKAFIAASNPSLAQGINSAPAIVSVELSDGVAKVTPVLYGNQTATDISTGKTVSLNLTDPDSMTVDPNGDLVLVSQADKELIFVHDPGGPDQKVSVLVASTQLGDTVWSTDPDGTLYVVDQPKNVIYKVRGALTAGTIFTETASDAPGTPSIVGTVDGKTGTVTPILRGFGSPSGLIFVTEKDMNDKSE
ncbi:MAG TPA: hypothetical protein VE591_13115 [Candidatus Acidoferrum sp.]|nr:hypothetical protein [Candidatus Acidoferrum sp.]